MKKNTSTQMSFIAIIALLFSITIANAQPSWPTQECKPKPPAITTIPAAPTTTVTQTTDMIPWLVSFDAADKVVKKEQLTSAISSTDTFYYDQKGNQIKKKDVVQWFPKYNNDLEKVIAGMKAMDVRSWFGTIYGWDYTKHESDSLAKRVVREINGKFDSRPLIASIYENSPHFRRLKELEATDVELKGLINALESRINNLPAPDMSGFVTAQKFNDVMAHNDTLWTLQDTLNGVTLSYSFILAAIDEHLSATKARLWERIKAKHGVVFYDWVPAIDEYMGKEIPDRFENEMPGDPPARPKQKKHSVTGTMSSVHQF